MNNKKYVFVTKPSIKKKTVQFAFDILLRNGYNPVWINYMDVKFIVARLPSADELKNAYFVRWHCKDITGTMVIE